MKLATLTRYVYYIFITIVIVGLGFNMFFLYNGFYKTMTEAEVVYMLRSEVSFEIVNINLWEKIEENIKYKKTPAFTGEEVFNNPFVDLEKN